MPQANKPILEALPRRTKQFHFEVKAVDDEQGLVEAHGSVFDNIDEQGEVVDPGAFTRTIKNNKSRVDNGKAAFLATMLYNHDTEHFLPIGGWSELKEDQTGLLCKGQIVLDIQLGRDVYTLIKKRVINQFSIGFDVPSGGHYWDDKGYRHLKEVRLWEVSPVVFAANQEALLVGVKSIQTKLVCGDTSLPIGPRGASWDSSEAEKQIFAYAEKEDGTLDADKLKKCFLSLNGDPQLKGSWGLPIVNIVDGSPVINVGGVKAVAGWLQGARG